MRLLPRKAEHVVLLGPFVAFAQSRHVAVIHGQLGKSPFDRECVVGLGGLELPTKTIISSWLGKCPKCQTLRYERFVSPIELQ